MPRSTSRKKKAMPATATARFDVAALRETAGEKVFARGAQYHEEELVEIVALTADRVRARVEGSETYDTELRGKGRCFTGECSCRAFSDWGFCKHLVATALAANAMSPNAVKEGTNRLSRIRSHLARQGVDSLVAMIMRLAEDDPQLLQELDFAAATDADDDAALLPRFKKALTDATRTRYFIDYRQAHDWAQGIDRVLDRVEGLLERGRPQLVLQLLDHFFARMEDTFEMVDDSDGHASGLCERAASIHLAACRQARPDGVALARDLFVRETEWDRDVFSGASDTYADLLGKTGLAEYRRLATEAWAKIKPRTPGSKRSYDEEPDRRYQLQAVVERFAERDGNVDGLIALKSKDLSSPYHYIGLAELCLAHGRQADALAWAEEGLWQFEKEPDERLVLCAANLYRRAGRKADAEKLLWQAFERQPSLELYVKLKAVAGRGKAGEAVTDRCVAALKARLAAAPKNSARFLGWSSEQDLLVGMLVDEGRLAAAWEAERDYGCGDRALEKLARASEKDHAAEAVQAYAQLVERAVAGTNAQGYEEAYRLIGCIGAVRKRQGEAKAHAAYLSGIMTRHKAKRNFMKLLRAKGYDAPVAS